MADKITLATAGVLALAAIEIAALFTGADGQLLSIVVGTIGTIVGGGVGYTAAKTTTEKTA